MKKLLQLITGLLGLRSLEGKLENDYDENRTMPVKAGLLIQAGAALAHANTYSNQPYIAAGPATEEALQTYKESEKAFNSIEPYMHVKLKGGLSVIAVLTEETLPFADEIRAGRPVKVKTSGWWTNEPIPRKVYEITSLPPLKS